MILKVYSPFHWLSSWSLPKYPSHPFTLPRPNPDRPCLGGPAVNHRQWPSCEVTNSLRNRWPLVPRLQFRDPARVGAYDNIEETRDMFGVNYKWVLAASDTRAPRRDVPRNNRQGNIPSVIALLGWAGWGIGFVSCWFSSNSYHQEWNDMVRNTLEILLSAIFLVGLLFLFPYWKGGPERNSRYYTR